jgi:maltose alpha-D-glucosyltransferase / alpha-amylase
MGSSPRSSKTPSRAAVAAALDGFAAKVFAQVLPRQRWFGGRGRRINSVSILDVAAFAAGTASAWLVLLDVAFAQGPSEPFFVPLTVRSDGSESRDVFGRVELDGVSAEVADAFDDPDFCSELLVAFDADATVRARHGTVRFVRTPAFPRLAGEEAKAPRRLRGEQSNTSVVYGDALILKSYRSPARGINPEREMTGFLTARGRFADVPQLAGAAEYAGADGTVMTLAVLQTFIRGRGDGWTWVLEHLDGLRNALITPAQREPIDTARLGSMVRDGASSLLGALRRLGGLTGGLHQALASDAADPAFAPEPITTEDTAAWAGRIDADLGRTCDILRARLPALPEAAQRRAGAVLAGEAALRACLGGLETLAADRCSKIRIHGDYHLGQTIRTDGGFVILDFEGEPARPPGQRRAKQSPLRDVAGMLRSFDYSAATAFGSTEELAAVGDAWRRLASGAFLDAYVEAASHAPVRLLPASRPALDRALTVFELDKALYEVRYEIDHRPDWVGVPLRGLHRLWEQGR